jgi:DNA-binding transcriptional MerR regulator
MKISEVSEACDFSSDTLRYYERIGLIPSIKRTRGGIREYSETDVKWIEFVKCMRNAGLSIETLIEYFKLFEQGDETAEARKDLLKEQRDDLAARIAELQKTLDYLDHKIAVYESHVLPAEKTIVQSEEE